MGVSKFSALMVLMSFGGVALLCATAPTSNMLHDHTIAHSVREVFDSVLVLLRGDRPLALLATAVLRRPKGMWTCHTRTWLPAVTAAGRQGCNAVSTFSALLLLTGICAVFRRKKLVRILPVKVARTIHEMAKR